MLENLSARMALAGRDWIRQKSRRHKRNNARRYAMYCFHYCRKQRATPAAYLMQEDHEMKQWRELP